MKTHREASGGYVVVYDLASVAVHPPLVKGDLVAWRTRQNSLAEVSVRDMKTNVRKVVKHEVTKNCCSIGYSLRVGDIRCDSIECVTSDTTIYKRNGVIVSLALHCIARYIEKAVSMQ